MLEDAKPFPTATFRVYNVRLYNFDGSNEEEFAFASRLVTQKTVVRKMMIETTSFPPTKKLNAEADVAKLMELPKGYKRLRIECFWWWNFYILAFYILIWGFYGFKIWIITLFSVLFVFSVWKFYDKRTLYLLCLNMNIIWFVLLYSCVWLVILQKRLRYMNIYNRNRIMFTWHNKTRSYK